ncbi:LLM class F420-dependent oxidoreductase, partial [Gordonia sp. ABSL1-1]|nr:LLM class F420-dependent oxidoreductase [Gordonia sp. ABSL1-1]
REGEPSVVDLAAIGSAASVTRQLRRYLDAGATAVGLSPLRSEPGDLEALWEVAAGLDSAV